jgi:hypothetical protein
MSSLGIVLFWKEVGSLQDNESETARRRRTLPAMRCLRVVLAPAMPLPIEFLSLEEQLAALREENR